MTNKLQIAGGKIIKISGKVSAPTIGGGGVTGIIPTAAAALSPGAVVQVTLPGPPWSINQGTISCCMEYCARIGWDPTNRKMRWWGCSHDNSVPTYFEYAVDTDTAYQETFDDQQGPPSNPHHSYDDYDCDTNGNMASCLGNLGGPSVNIRPAGGGWTFFTPSTPTGGQWHNMVYHVGLGQFVDFQTWGVYSFTWASGGSDWGQLSNTSALISGDQGAAAYNYLENCAYGAFGTTVLKCTAAGAVSTVASCPLSLEYPSGTTQSSLYAASRTTNKMRAIDATGANTYAYDAGGNSWGSSVSLNSSIVSYLGGASDGQWISGPLKDAGGPGKGVMIYSRCTVSGSLIVMDPNVWLEAY